MTITPQAQKWLDLAEIDYIGPFVKVWAAFNAWYRDSSGERRERDMLKFAIRHNNSQLRLRVLPLLQKSNRTIEACQLKQAICDLQNQLDSIQLEVVSNGFRERVSLREVCISPDHLNDKHRDRSGQKYRAKKITDGHIEVTVTTISNNNVKFQHVQERYDPPSLYSLPDFTEKLSVPQQRNLREFYDKCNPRPMTDLVGGGGPPPLLSAICPRPLVSAMDFHCTAEDLLAGLVETLYTMRNALLHGEVRPDRQVFACFEPAYRIVKCFLRSMMQ